MAHIRKAYTQRRVVLTPQRRGDQTGNVVRQQHQVPGVQIPANTAAGVGEDYSVDPHLAHQANGHHHLLGRIALIQVHPAVHEHHFFAANGAKDKSSFVSRRRRDRKTGYIAVRQSLCPFYSVCKGTKAAAQHNTDLRLSVS